MRSDGSTVKQWEISVELNQNFEPHYGQPVEIAPVIRRMTVNNPGPFTFHGTNTYLVGDTSLAVIDPGPEDETHLNALLDAIGSRPVSHIIVTHTHRDHSPLARRLAEITGAPTAGFGSHRPSRKPALHELAQLDASGDSDFIPDITLADGQLMEGDGWSLRTLHTPGHATNHCAFALEGTGITFSGDHVMAWSTTVISPPDGSMTDYMASLDKLLERNDTLLLPGHGGPVTKPPAFLRGLKAHRRMRERAILERLSAGDRTIAEIVAAIYRDTDPRLHRAAASSVFAHLEDLIKRERVKSDGEPSITAEFTLI